MELIQKVVKVEGLVGVSVLIFGLYYLIKWLKGIDESFAQERAAKSHKKIDPFFKRSWGKVTLKLISLPLAFGGCAILDALEYLGKGQVWIIWSVLVGFGTTWLYDQLADRFGLGPKTPPAASK